MTYPVSDTTLVGVLGDSMDCICLGIVFRSGLACWWGRGDLNPGPRGPKPRILARLDDGPTLRGVCGLLWRRGRDSNPRAPPRGNGSLAGAAGKPRCPLASSPPPWTARPPRRGSPSVASPFRVFMFGAAPGFNHWPPWCGVGGVRLYNPFPRDLVLYTLGDLLPADARAWRGSWVRRGSVGCAGTLHYNTLHRSRLAHGVEGYLLE